MKKLLSTLLILSLTAPLFGQRYDPNLSVTVFHNDDGKNVLTQSAINTSIYCFPSTVLDYAVDPGRGVLNALLSTKNQAGEKTTTLVAYDMRRQVGLWSQDALSIESLLSSGGLLVSVEGKHSVLRNPVNGKPIWKASGRMFHIDSTTQRGIGFRFSSGGSFVEGIELKTGKPLWSNAILVKKGWAGYSWIDDSRLCVKASGLNIININTGNGWVFDTTIGQNPYDSKVIANTWAVFGIVGAMISIPAAYRSGIEINSGLCSDILVDSGDIYFAGREEVVCLDPSGATKWQQELPKKMTSASHLLLDNGVLYVVNKGEGFQDGEQKAIGISFVAAFSANDGTPIFNQQIGEKKSKKIIRDQIAVDGNLYLIYDKTVARCSPATGEIVQEKTFAENISHFLKGDVFLRNGADFMPLTELSARGNVYVAKSDGNVVGLTADLAEMNAAGFGNEFVRYYKGGNYSFLACDGHTVVINGQNHEVGDFGASDKARLIGNTLYDWLGSMNILAVDVSAFVDAK